SGDVSADVEDAMRELTAIAARRRELQQQMRDAEAAMAAIRASNSWRALEAARRMRLRARHARMSFMGLLGRMRGMRSHRDVPLAVRQAPVGVNVAGYLAAESGLGEAARSSVRVLQHTGIPVVLNNVPGAQRTGDTTFTEFVRENPHPFNLVHLNADNMPAFAVQQKKIYFRDKYTIGFWFWELSRFRKDWQGAFRVVDEVWVATRFARDAIQPASPVPVVRMPLPVTVAAPSTRGRAHFGIPDDRFAFLFTFDVSSQTERKNPMGVIRAFQRSGLGRGRAVLVLKFTNGHFDREAVRRLREASEGVDVLLLDGYMDRADLSALVRACDCYVSLHRAEGFGLTMAEAMALERPVIATAYSGNMDFMAPDTACLIDYRLVPLTWDYGPYLRGFEWADPDIDQAAAAMRRMVESPDWAKALGQAGPVVVERHLGMDAAVERCRRRLEVIRSGAVREAGEDA
ncbi:MAG: glycosyltransferase family 4 protein, partial [Vicinamibacterales bacterium]|nr:glycosyltransferase family 4 protein [Vicinamibacterales bacterium]